MKKKVVFGFIAIIIILGVVIVMFNILRKSNTPASELTFSEISLIQSEKKAIIIGELTSSGKSYRGYDYRIEGDMLIIKINSGLVNTSHLSGDFSIEIIDNQIANLQNIAIESGKDIVQVYPK